MGLNLTIDQGNSSVKIAIWDGSTLVDEETARELSRQQLARIVDRFHPARALCCSVTGNGDRYVQWLTAMGLSARQVSSDMPLPVKIGYTTPQTLGSDRIAAAVGACSLLPGESLLVVDMGTAVTYDHVNADGVFVGGNIAPALAPQFHGPVAADRRVRRHSAVRSRHGHCHARRCRKGCGGRNILLPLAVAPADQGGAHRRLGRACKQISRLPGDGGQMSGHQGTAQYIIV